MATWIPHQGGHRTEARRLDGPAERPRKLAPWWARAHATGQGGADAPTATEEHGPAAAAAASRVAEPELYGRRSVVKASFRRNRNGGWAAHARYLARADAQHEHERGRGLRRRTRASIWSTVVREWERDELMWPFIVSPEDAGPHRPARPCARAGRRMERDLGTRLEWVAIDHHNTDDAARSSTGPGSARRRPHTGNRSRLLGTGIRDLSQRTNRTGAGAAAGARVLARPRTGDRTRAVDRNRRRWSAGQASSESSA